MDQALLHFDDPYIRSDLMDVRSWSGSSNAVTILHLDKPLSLTLIPCVCYYVFFVYYLSDLVCILIFMSRDSSGLCFSHDFDHIPPYESFTLGSGFFWDNLQLLLCCFDHVFVKELLGCDYAICYGFEFCAAGVIFMGISAE